MLKNDNVIKLKADTSDFYHEGPPSAQATQFGMKAHENAEPRLRCA